MKTQLSTPCTTSVCIAFLFGTIVKLISSQECQTVNAVHGYRLVNHVLNTVHDVTFERCTVLCTEHPACYSINHFTTTSTCELNNKTKLWFLSDFISSDSVFYMDMLVRQYDICVHDNPCRNDAKCIPYPNNGTFHCQCSKYYTGKTCEDLRKGGNVSCSNQVLDLCHSNMTAWQATILGPTSLNLSGCNPDDITNTAELLLFVSRARTDSLGDYGKYQIVKVKENTGCTVTLLAPINITLSGSPCELIAQRLPYFDHISLTQSCQVTCRARSGEVGGILALRATKLTIDSTSKIQVNGKGFHGGAGGSSSGGGGFGGETFVCLSSTYGKGGDAGQTGDHGGGSGEGLYLCFSLIDSQQMPDWTKF
ncbi:uncharacterized protein LOC116301185 isoform X1 [Actinia tenebrosa]|uniref:Uncharacterized protein LOC116301185 isoform X1 n=1 Tax=Actinia tenebrosa TaxID=6105 RepID=A0A6P8IH30_ACTTE|nr:uncharacterized protein LOC116301185 isoform X1 [Actinia tenebrosa]